ncbi:hypothetical protein PG997_005048 [Apiospora hydei]|uniref:Uncharacterized protein n=1 Tax=Apiospora hydei TaxID=1337664 RepID=A0ABR1X3U5_9PEZI
MVILRNRWLPIAVAIVSFWSAQQAEAAGLLSLPLLRRQLRAKVVHLQGHRHQVPLHGGPRGGKVPARRRQVHPRRVREPPVPGHAAHPLRASCLVLGKPIPNSAIRDGNAVLKDPVSSSSTTAKSSSSTATSTAKATTATTTTSAQRTTTAIPTAPPLTTAIPTLPSSTTTAAAATSITSAASPPPEQTSASSLSTSTRVAPSSSPALDSSKGDDKGSGLPTDPFAAPVEKGSSSRVGRQAPMFTGALMSSATVVLIVFAWS